MKRIALGLILSLWASIALAQLPPAGGIVVGNTPVQGGTTGQCLYKNGNVLGAQACGAGTAANIQVGTTTVGGGTSGYVLYNNAGTLGNFALGTGVQTALGVNTGSAGAVVLFNGALGTPSSGTLTNATGLPISTGVSGLGTGVATALAVNTGSAGAVVLLNGALGTPSSGTLTNATGLPISTGVSGLGTGIATALGTAAVGSGAIGLGYGDAWTAFTPTIAAGAGSFTTASAAGRYKQVGKTYLAEFTVTITTNGTASSYYTLTLPNSAAAQGGFGCSGADNATAKALSASGRDNSNLIYIWFYDGTYPGATGATQWISCTFEAR